MGNDPQLAFQVAYRLRHRAYEAFVAVAEIARQQGEHEAQFVPIIHAGTLSDGLHECNPRWRLHNGLCGHLAAGGPFLTGEPFTVADAYLFTILSWSKLVDVDLSGFSSVRAYLERVGRRPAVREAMKAEGLKVQE